MIKQALLPFMMIFVLGTSVVGCQGLQPVDSAEGGDNSEATSENQEPGADAQDENDTPSPTSPADEDTNDTATGDAQGEGSSGSGASDDGWDGDDEGEDPDWGEPDSIEPDEGCYEECEWRLQMMLDDCGATGDGMEPETDWADEDGEDDGNDAPSAEPADEPEEDSDAEEVPAEPIEPDETEPSDDCVENAYQDFEWCIEECSEWGDPEPHPMNCPERCDYFSEDIYWMCMESVDDEAACEELSSDAKNVCMESCAEMGTDWCEPGDTITLVDESGYGWDQLQYTYNQCLNMAYECMPAYDLSVDIDTGNDNEWFVHCVCECPEHDIPPPDSCEEFSFGGSDFENGDEAEDHAHWCEEMAHECGDGHILEVNHDVYDSGAHHVSCVCACPDDGPGPGGGEIDCPDYSSPNCGDGQHVEWFLDDMGCSYPECVPDDDDTVVGVFQCGDDGCAMWEEYCETLYPGQPQGEIQYQCHPLPDDCESSAGYCGCIDSVVAGAGSCSEEDGIVQVSIYAP